MTTTNEVEAAKANVASLKEQRQLTIQEIWAAREPYGLPLEIINAKLVSLPALDAAIVDAETQLNVLMKGP